MRELIVTYFLLATFGMSHAYYSSMGVSSTRKNPSHIQPKPSLAIHRNTPILSLGCFSPAFSSSGKIISSQSTSRAATTALFLSDGTTNNHGMDPPRKRDRIAQIARAMINMPKQAVIHFQRLSSKGKRLFLVQSFVIVALLGGISRSYVARNSPNGRTPPIEIAYSSFLDIVDAQSSSKQDLPRMDRVRIGNDRILYRLYREGDSSSSSSVVNQLSFFKNRRKPTATQYINAYTRKLPASPELVNLFRKNHLSFTAAPQTRSTTIATALRAFFVAFYCLVLFRLYRTISGAGGGAGAGGTDSPGKLARTSQLPAASFDDIQGIDEAKLEVMELVDALMFPDKYKVLGARAPTGLLLEGPSGTGKTMLARATAAAAGVPLLYCSGSEFVEMFVGRGAARVRKLFERAQKIAPCIIFIDELDALGKARDAGGLAGFTRSNDEAEQTLNQLLVAMDGLDSSRRICVLAATNRRNVLDPALIRPGRFDRIVTLRLPDAKGRENILRVHCKKLPGFEEGRGTDPNRLGSLGIGGRIDLNVLSRVTEGFSGAELEYLVNEAAIRAVRRVSSAIRDRQDSENIVPHVQSSDFEAALSNFYETRRSRGLGDIMKGIW